MIVCCLVGFIWIILFIRNCSWGFYAYCYKQKSTTDVLNNSHLKQEPSDFYVLPRSNIKISIWYPVKLIIKKKQLVAIVIFCYNFQYRKLVTTYCIYNGLLILDVMVERPSKNGVSFNQNVAEQKKKSGNILFIRLPRLVATIQTLPEFSIDNS